jgi:class 3 adenylate cyclase/tetratricopeptide (TPR) repeat protein
VDSLLAGSYDSGMPVCQRCGEENPERARFCLACAAPLTAPTVARREERKRVSVLFCDLVGFTSRSERLDVEDVRGLLAPYYRRLRSELERFGGTVEKFIGDAVMALFGAPVAHEDDPERAVRAALAIREAIAELNEADPSLDLHVRVGVTTGEALVVLDARPVEGEGMASGDVVNTAARLQAAAPVDGVLVDETTYRATSLVIELEQADPVAAKGKADPVPVWLALAARANLGVDVSQAPRTRLVGRDHELGLLREALARMRRGRAAQLLTLVGVPGIGKSRLVFELLQRVEAEPELTTWRQGRSLPYGEGVAFWALGEMVKAEAGILDSDPAEVAAAKLHQAANGLLLEGAEAAWVAAHLRPLVGLGADGGSGGDRQAEAFAAWRRFLEALAERGPTVLVFEDLHWADDALLDFLDYLVEWTVDLPLLVFCTARPELLSRRPGWGGGKANSAIVSLLPLNGDDTARLIAALLDQALLPADTQAALLARAGGNPLYAEEFVRMLIDRGFLRRTGAGWRLERADQLPLPESVQGIIGARLDALTPEEKALLQDAAVIGKVGWVGALAALGGTEPFALEPRLHALERKEFLRRERRTTVAGERQYAFRHVLVRDVAYDQLPRAARVTKHAAAAAWIEQMAGERVADHAEILAYHYETALELARLAGAADEAAHLEVAVSRFMALAGDRAMGLDIARADAYYQRALELYAPDDPESAGVLAKAAEAAFQVGRLAEADRLYEQASNAYRASDDVLGASSVDVRRLFVLWWRGEAARVRGALADAVQLLEQQPPSPALATAYQAKAADNLFMGQPGAALQWAEKAIALAGQVGADEAHQLALQMRGLARFDLGDLGGLEDLREALEFGIRLGLGRVTAVTYSNLAEELQLAEGPGAALECYREGLDLCRKRGMAGMAIALQSSMLECLFDLGDWDELLTIADDVLAWYKPQGGGYDVIYTEAQKARLHVWRGELAAAAVLAEDFLPRARLAGEPQVLIAAFPVAALLAQARGDSLAAIQLVEELNEATKDHPAKYRALPLPDLTRVCVTARHLPLAERLLEDLDVPIARVQHCLVTAQAVVTEARGALGQAGDLYEDAAERWSDYGSLPERGQALLGLGRCLVQLGHPNGRTRLVEARSIFARLAARPLLAATDAWLEPHSLQGP